MLDTFDKKETRTKEKTVEATVRKMKSSPKHMLNMKTWA